MAADSDRKPDNARRRPAHGTSPFDPDTYRDFMQRPVEEQIELSTPGPETPPSEPTQAAQQTDLSGQRIGQYVLIEPIGRHGPATVYLAHQTSMLRDVAVKVLSPRFGDDPAFAAAFRREAELAARLDHPNILPIYDFGQEGDYVYIVTRYVPTGSLFDRLGKGPLAPATVLKVVAQIAAALEHAHEQGIVHRDVKPSNVMLDDDNTAYLTDFGLATVLQAQRAVRAEAEVLLGTPGYVAPEQMHGELVDLRADVYALGALAFEMLTGRPPFVARTPVDIALKHVSEPVPDPRQYRADLPESVALAIHKAMAKAPDNRYNTAHDFATALREAFGATPDGWREAPDVGAAAPETPPAATLSAGSLSHLAEPLSPPIAPGARGGELHAEEGRSQDDDAEPERVARRRLSGLLSGSETVGDVRPAVRQLVDQPGGVGVSVKAPRRSIWPDAPPVGAAEADSSGNGLVISGHDFARRVRAKYGFDTAPEIDAPRPEPEPLWKRIAARIPLLDTGGRFLTTALAVGAVIALVIFVSSRVQLPAPDDRAETTAESAPTEAAVAVQPTAALAPTSAPRPTATREPVTSPAAELPSVDIELKMEHFGWQSAGDGDQIYDLALSDGSVWAATGAGLYRWHKDGEFTHFAAEHGLASNRVRALAVQPDGALWAGTLGSGLSRHDGAGWQTFTTQDGLPGNVVNALALDGEGALWVGTDNGLAQFDGQAWQTFSVENGEGPQAVSDLVFDGDGDLWAVTETGVSQFDGQTLLTFVTAEALHTTAVTAIGVDGAGAIWAGTTGGGVARFDGEAWNRFVGVEFEQATVRDIRADFAGNLWVASDAGLHKFDGSDWTTATPDDGLPGADVWAIAAHPDSGVWAGTRSGLARQQGAHWQPFLTGDGLDGNAIQALDFDSRGQVWIGTFGGGLATFNGNAWRSYGVDDGLAAPDVWTLLVDGDDVVWTGTLGGGLSRFDGETWRTFTVEDGLAGNSIWTLALDPRGPLWVTTSGRGAFELQGEAFVPHSVTSAGEPWALDFAADANQWMGTFDGELVREVDGVPVWAAVPNANASPSDRVLATFVDDVGRVWLGTSGGGALMFNGARWEDFTVDDGLAANTVWAVAAGPGNSIWFGTSEGVSIYNGTSWRSFGTQDGLAAKEVRALGVAPDGRLWVGTSGGLSIVDPEDAQLYR